MMMKLMTETNRIRAQPRRAEIRRWVLLIFILLSIILLVVSGCASRKPRPPTEGAIRHNNLGVALMDAGVKEPSYFPEAVKEFEAALEASPAYASARINLGIASYYAGQKERALATLESVAREAPDDLHVNYMLGLIKESDGDYRAAKERFAKVTRQDPQEPNGWYHLGYCASKEGRYEEAVEPFRQAAALMPYQRAFRYNLFMALNRAGNQAEAQEELDNFKLLETSSIRVVDSSKNAQEYLKQGKYAEAIAESNGAPPPPRPAPQYVNVAAQVGLNFRHAGAANDAKLQRALQGEAMPRRWFADEANRRKLIAALGAGAAFCDYNNDGRLDIFLVNVIGGHALFEQRADGKFENVTVEVELSAAEPKLGMACAWGDFDNDGWADLLITGYGGVRLYRNNRGRFEDVSKAMGITQVITQTSWCMGAAFADVDHDGDLDIYITRLVELSLLPEQDKLRFPDDFTSQPNLLFRNNLNGSFTEIAQQAKADGAGHKNISVWFADVNDDRAVDFLLFDRSGRPATFLNNKDGTFASSPQQPTDLPPRALPGEARAFGDFNRDGAVDELSLRNGALAVLNRNETRQANWLTVRLEGYAAPGQVKSNRMGIGAKVEARSVGRWERRELRAGNGALGNDAAEIYFDLGDQSRVDFVRAIFPSGVRWTLRDVRANQIVKLDEPLLDVNSCPALFAWNGARFEFITDTISAGILGELVAPGAYWRPDPDEWVRITSSQLTPSREQRLELRFVNPLEEVTYLDRVRLLAIDHPPQVEVYPNERMVNEPKHREPAQVYALTDFRPIARATDDHGHDVTAELAQVDRRYFGDFTPLPFKGFAGDWSLTLDLGARQPASAVLLLHSWSYWNSSASIIAAAQANQKLWGPILEVMGKDGRWRVALDDMGVSAGLPRTVVVDLSQALKPGERMARIRSNRTLYYDQIVTARKVERLQIEQEPGASSQMRASEAPMLSAELRWLGYPRRLKPDGKLPETYDFGHIEQQADWGTHAGMLTRYGDALPLLARGDDQFVVMGHGEEVALSFDANRLPGLPAGWKRTYLFYSLGYEKSYELHSAQSQSIGPLPFQAMESYPQSGRRYPTDEDHLRYLFEWNTRPCFIRR
jgi:Flp pilus assembly protein TadD